MKDFFLIAKIVSLYGKNGFVRIETYSDYPERFFQLDEVFVDKFKNFNDEREAGIFLGRDIYVKENDLVKLPEGSYFIHDLIGSKVYQGRKKIGIITDVIQPPANDVIVIQGEKKKEILIPLVLEFIEEFDPENKKLVLKEEVVYDDED
ncbi:MAG: ribosome maturation factor RimM [Ignavibacteriaceae bacterium]